MNDLYSSVFRLDHGVSELIPFNKWLLTQVRLGNLGEASLVEGDFDEIRKDLNQSLVGDILRRARRIGISELPYIDGETLEVLD